MGLNDKLSLTPYLRCYFFTLNYFLGNITLCVTLNDAENLQILEQKQCALSVQTKTIERF